MPRDLIKRLPHQIRIQFRPERSNGVPVESNGIKRQPKDRVQKHDCERSRMSRRLPNRRGPVLLSYFHASNFNQIKRPGVEPGLRC
jgi:hypothetical protein